MDADDLEPAKVKPSLRNLETLSIEALNDYVAGLEAELERARAMIATKEAARTSANSVFRT